MGKSSRLAFGEAIAEIGSLNKNIVVLDADLSKSTMSNIFAKKYPDRFFEMGIQEQNMIGVAAGLALSGKIPFICSFSIFLLGRFETIRMSVAYSNTNVKLIGTHCGIGIGEDGYSQMGLEDISLMRSFPNMSIMQPADEIETKEIIKYAAENFGPMFIRLTRQNLEDVHSSDYKFSFGKGDLLLDGNDATVFCTGGVVGNTLAAAKELEKEGIKIRVINIHTIKPIDTDIIIKAAKETNYLFTIEDHSIIGGLGSSVCEVLSENYPKKVKRLGIVNSYGESGSPEALYEKHNLHKEGIINSIKTELKKGV
jgi:transketolase